MTPFQLAAKIYETEPCARPFELDLYAHLHCGWVVSTPDVFAMARPVDRGAAYEEITNPWREFHGGDAWWIYVYAGDLSRGLEHLPFDLPWIGWERNNVPRFFRLDHLKRKLQSRIIPRG